MIVTMKASNRGIRHFRGVPMTGMIMSMAGGAMIVVAMIMVVIVVVPGVIMIVIMGIRFVIVMIMSAAAGMVALFDLWRGGIALRQRENLVPQSRDALGDAR